MFKPEQIKIAITGSDGVLYIMAFVTKSYHPGLIKDYPGVIVPKEFIAEDGKIAHFIVPPTVENINKEIAKCGIDCVSWKIITDDEIPPDRTFRNAWKVDGGIVVDMPKAREIHKDALRRQRAPLLAKLDADYMRADERGDAAAKEAIAAQKQALRDVTAKPEIEAAQTPEDLKAIAL